MSYDDWGEFQDELVDYIDESLNDRRLSELYQTIDSFIN